MLSLFPGLLFLTPLAIALVRVAVGLTIFYIGYRVFMERDAITALDLPIIGHMSVWMSVFAAIVGLLLGALFVIGLWTQGVAIVGMLLSLKHFVFARKYPQLIPLSRSTYVLLFVMCLALLFTGAGALGVDLPL